MSDLLPPGRRARSYLAAARLGVLLLAPAVILGGTVVTGIAIPWLVRLPLLVFGGLIVALLVNVAASVRWRAEATDEALRVECDVRIRYRGAHRAVLVVGAGLATILVMYLVVMRLSPR